MVDTVATIEAKSKKQVKIAEPVEQKDEEKGNNIKRKASNDDNRDSPVNKKPKKRTKSFRGCFTCRRRKIACDQMRPVCGNCRRSGYVCDGYEIKLRWSQPIQFDKYGYQLHIKQYQQEKEYFHRRAVDFVKYSDKTAYHLYDEMDRDLASLHSLYMPDTRTKTVIKGHFGVFRGAVPTNVAIRKDRHGKGRIVQSDVNSRSSSVVNVRSDMMNQGKVVSAPPMSMQNSSIPGTPNSIANMSTTTTGSAAMVMQDSHNRNSYQGYGKNYTPGSNGTGSTSGRSGNAPGNEWLSTELFDAALLTASAINGDTHFLDMLKPEDFQTDEFGNYIGNNNNGNINNRINSSDGNNRPMQNSNLTSKSHQSMATGLDISDSNQGGSATTPSPTVTANPAPDVDTSPTIDPSLENNTVTNPNRIPRTFHSTNANSMTGSNLNAGNTKNLSSIMKLNGQSAAISAPIDPLRSPTGLKSTKLNPSPNFRRGNPKWPIAPAAIMASGNLNSSKQLQRKALSNSKSIRFTGKTTGKPSFSQPINKDAVSDNMLHLLFQGRNTDPPTTAGDDDSTTNNSGSTTSNGNGSSIASNNGNTSIATTNANQNFSRSDKPIASNNIKIHAGNGSKMPRNIMEILQTTPLPRSLAIDKFGIPTSSLSVQPMARYLLNYYIEDVADMMTVIPLPKNPWKFIYFPRAVMAIGELAALGHTSNARNALLNALLAVCAFNLQSKFTRGSDEMKYYVNLGIQLRQQANNFLTKCLQVDVLKQKYKDVLCAVLSMVTIDVVWGTMSSCKIHLDHCEKIIEKKMKVKKKLSSKAIILHRIFSSLKLIQDSTCIDSISKDEIFLNEKNYDKFIMGAKPTPEQLEKFFNSNFHDMFRGSRLRRQFARSVHTNDHGSVQQSFGNVFRKHTKSMKNHHRRGKYNERITDNGKVRIEFIMNSDDEGTKKNEQKVSSEESNNSKTEQELSKALEPSKDIPAFIGITRSSFQPSKNKLDDKIVSSDAIYGLPNSLILMFSEVVHLTKFKLYHTENKLELPSFFDELMMQLEYKLLTWKLEWKLTESDDKQGGGEKEDEEDFSDQTNSDSDDQQKRNRKFLSPRHEGIYHHVMSFYYGLTIYFYRFVEDVNPMYLQDRVEKVLYHLNAIQDILQKHPETSYIIPLFWQGFIAGSEAMTLYLQNGFNLWGQHIAQTGIGTYWNARQIMLEIWRRKNHNVKKNSWIDVLRDWKTNVMLT